MPLERLVPARFGVDELGSKRLHLVQYLLPRRVQGTFQSGINGTQGRTKGFQFRGDVVSRAIKYLDGQNSCHRLSPYEVAATKHFGEVDFVLFHGTGHSRFHKRRTDPRYHGWHHLAQRLIDGRRLPEVGNFGWTSNVCCGWKYCVLYCRPNQDIRAQREIRTEIRGANRLSRLPPVYKKPTEIVVDFDLFMVTGFRQSTISGHKGGSNL